MNAQEGKPTKRPTTRMREPNRVLTCLTILIVIATLSGCVGAQDSARNGGQIIPITDVGSVAGTWTGVVFRTTGREQNDSLEINVKTDGTFQTFSARQIGALLGNGTLTIANGRMTAIGSNGTATLTLYDRQGRTLVMDFVGNTGVRYSGELRPKK